MKEKLASHSKGSVKSFDIFNTEKKLVVNHRCNDVYSIAVYQIFKCHFFHASPPKLIEIEA